MAAAQVYRDIVVPEDECMLSSSITLNQGRKEQAAYYSMEPWKRRKKPSHSSLLGRQPRLVRNGLVASCALCSRGSGAFCQYLDRKLAYVAYVGRAKQSEYHAEPFPILQFCL